MSIDERAAALLKELSPSGRLPITFYNDVKDLPDYADYSMKNRTYRYFTGEVQYPFGFGLSYTSFEYNWIKKPLKRYSKNNTLNIKRSYITYQEIMQGGTLEFYMGSTPNKQFAAAPEERPVEHLAK